MTKRDFLEQLQEELEFETQLTEETLFGNLEEWDSLSVMVLIGFVSEHFGISLKAAEIAELAGIQALIEKIGFDKFSGE